MFDERLIQQHRFLKELVKTAFDDSVDHLVWLVCILGIVLRLRPGDLTLLFQIRSRNVLTRDITRLSSRDMHSYILYELLKFFASRNEIRLTVYFDKDTDLAAHVNIRTDDAFGCDPAFALLRGSQSALPQDLDSAFFISLSFCQGVLAFHHARACLFTKLLYCA